MADLLAKAEELSVVGIIEPNEETVMASLTGGLGYTSELKTHVIEEINNTQLAQEQLASPNLNVLTGLEFVTGEAASAQFHYESLSDEEKPLMRAI